MSRFTAIRSLSLLGPAAWVLLLMACLSAGPALGAEQTEPMAGDQPIKVVSERLEVDNKTKVASFLGKVRATQGDLIITSDQLDVHYDSGDEKEPPARQEGKSPGLLDGGGRVNRVVALGHVRIIQKDRVAISQKATYWAGGRKILLEGKATVWQGKNQVSGNKVTVFLDEKRSVVHGSPGQQVTVTIIPGSSR